MNIGSAQEIDTAWGICQIIAEASKQKKQDCVRLSRLENEMKRKEELSQIYSDCLLKQVCELKYSFNHIYNEKAEHVMFRLKSNFY